MKKTSIRTALGGAVLAMTLGGNAYATECIAPADAGGGWDFTCRQIGKLLYDLKLVDQPVQVTNMAGAGGGVAYTHVVTERNEDADLIVAASSATTTRLAQNAYAGMTADQVRFVGAIGGDPGVIVVAKDSPFQTLGDLVEAITQTIGGFTQAMTGDMSEISGFIKSGDVRALAVLTAEPVPGFEEIPTAKSQGFDVEVVNWRGLYVPKGISDEAFNGWAEKLQTVADSAEWKQIMADNGLAPFTKVGGDFQGWIDGVVADTTQLSKDIGVIQ